MRVPTLLVVFTLLAALAVACLAPLAEASPATDTAAASSRDRDWYPTAMKWERALKKAQRHARQHARFLGVKVPCWVVRSIDVPVLPNDPNCGQYDWKAWAHTWRKQTLAVRRYVKRTWRRMRYPKGSDPNRWIPLARHCGWPERAIPMLRKVIRRESGGNPRCSYCGHLGLLQIARYHTTVDLFNPNTNLRYGYLMWRRLGWAPWAATAW